MRLPVEGYESIYEIDECGNVYSLDRVVTNGKGSQRVKGCVLKSIAHKGHGYHVVNLADNGKVRQKRVHILVAQAFIPNPEGKPTVNHKDGIKAHNHKNNLEWATMQEQMDHAAGMGLTAKHMRNARSKLTDDVIYQAFARCMSGEELQAVSTSIGVNRNALPKAFRRIGLGQAWDTEAQRRKADASRKRWRGA